MAQLVLGLGTSHSPLVATDAPMWEQRAISDRSNPELYDLEGNLRTYEELAQSSRSYLREASLAHLTQQSHKVQAALDRLAADLAVARPDVVLIVGDDQHELFDARNLPAISIFYGDKAITHTFGQRRIGDPEFMRVLSKAYAMDQHHQFECDGGFARGLIEHLIESGIDIGASAKVSDPETHGFGHAYGFIVTRLMAKVPARIVPVMLNTYYPPNQPTPARCYAIGRAIRAAIDASKLNRRVAVVASGGIAGVDTATGKIGGDLEAQVTAMFANVRRIVEAGGGTTEDIIKVTVWVRDRAARLVIDPHWTKTFPDAKSRPARHTLVYQLPDRCWSNATSSRWSSDDGLSVATDAPVISAIGGIAE